MYVPGHNTVGEVITTESNGSESNEDKSRHLLDEIIVVLAYDHPPHKLELHSLAAQIIRSPTSKLELFK